MPTSAIESPAQAASIASLLFQELAKAYENCKFSVKLWNGTEIIRASNPRFTLVICNPRVLPHLFNSPDELTLGESFIRGDLDIEGDLGEALQFAEFLMTYKPGRLQKVALGGLAAILSEIGPRLHSRDKELTGDLHSRQRDREAIARHYDVSNDFYRLWLDRHMVYTAAYFESPEDDLDTAQVRKLDYICRKLRLQPGDKLLDIGCGWGGLLLHAASHYGVQARGITLSMRQVEWARAHIRSAGLEDRCDVQICDYRDVEGIGTYDKIASIGMVEHVGRSMLKPYFTQAWRLLRSGGVFLNSGIAASATWQCHGASFMDRYVFPDWDLVPLYTTIQEAELSGLEVKDVEDLGEHYALTLDRWVKRLEAHGNEARQASDDITCRIWKLYMAASARAFRNGRINLYQVLFRKSDHDGCDLSLTRRDWYKTTSDGDQNWADRKRISQ